MLTETPAVTNLRYTTPQFAGTIMARAIRHEGRTWLLAVNSTDTPASAKEPLVASRQNLLVNGGFENNSHWAFSTDQDSSAQAQGSLDTKDRHTGRRAAMIVRKGARSQSAWTGPAVTLKPETLYRFGGWAKALPLGVPLVEIGLQQADGPSAWKELRGRTLTVKHFGPWCRYSTVFRTDDKPLQVRPTCTVRDYARVLSGELPPDAGVPSDGTASFDDLFLVESPPDVTNMLLNASFEGPEHAPGWPKHWIPGWGFAVPGQIGGPDSLWGRDGAVAYEGKSSFRLVCPHDFPPGTPPDRRPRLEQSPVKGVRFAKGRSYVLSAYLKADRDQLPVSVYAGSYRSMRSFKLSREWQRYTLPVSADEDIEQPNVRFEMQQAGTLWIDNVQLEAGSKATSFNEWQLDPSHSFSE